MYPIEKYKFVEHTLENGNKEIFAISTYAGKTVKGVAKCAPGDTFDEDKGKKLAAARCEEKVAKKRLRRAIEKRKMAYEAYIQAKTFYENCQEYECDSKWKLEEAINQNRDILANL